MVVSPILIYSVLGSLILWTVRYSKRSQAEGEARAAAALAAQTAGSGAAPA